MLPDVGAHSTSMIFSGWESSESALVQSRRCTDTPLPRVTKPRMSSPGTGVQHRASLTQTSAMPLTTTPGSPCAARLGRAVDRHGGLGDVLARALLAADRGDEARDDVLGRDVALADRGVERRRCPASRSSSATPVRDSTEVSRCSGRPCLRMTFARESLPSSIISSRRSLVNQCRILLRARAERTKRQPVARRARRVGLGGEHLDDVAVVEPALERHEAAVDPGADAVVADLGVHRVGEVDRGRPGRQPDELALRGEDVDLAGVDLEAQRLEELARVGGLLLPVEQLAQPRHVVDRRRSGRRGPAPHPGRRCPWPRGPPCTSSARRRRTRPGGASCGCGSGSRPACPRGR